ncbi:MAG: methylated-DNA--[protein]-cysteine S-methyltransferase [Acidimicrobiia bacterium]|nr:methylated-DNA--[protein]-cysteine S-methyltransferase [Acidimicrobiia bacterium]
MKQLSIATKPSPVGVLTLIASESGLRAILWPNDKPGRVRFEEDLVEDASNPYIRKASDQLDEFFAGTRDYFDIPLDLVGTEFQIAVWTALQQIPFGETTSYGTMAEDLGKPTAARAVGAAVGRNPLSIVIPCHRVVGKNGSLTGFAGGLDAKVSLLDLESKR